mgnify:CR=1 FL=1|tara:strand:+ start:553 stop:1380 length:828 start_codon:yes stop_codon:yes gene_type:complete
MSDARSFQIQNQLGQQSADMNELRLNGWKTQTIAFKALDGREQDKKDADIKTDVESDVTKVDQVYKVASATGRAAKGAAIVAKEGGSLREAGAVAGKAFSEVGAGTKLFGQGATAVKDLTGVEGVIAGTLLKGGGETFAKVGAKGLGAVGAGLAAYQDIDNLADTGNIFKTKDAAGNVVNQNIGVDVGNVATIIGGALDVATAFTGGALAPLAAAVNIFAAVDGAISGIKQDADNKKVDEKDAPPKAPPTSSAPPAFAQYGILANQSHNPLNHIN